MDEINHSFSWGGYRPGAGQKPKWNHGATMTVRVPQKLADEIMHYARLIDGQFPSGLQVSDCLSCQLYDDSVTQSRDLAGQLEKVAKERDQLDKECTELADKVGMLHLQVEELKQHDDSVTQSSFLQAQENEQLKLQLQELQNQVDQLKAEHESRTSVLSIAMQNVKSNAASKLIKAVKEAYPGLA